MLTLSSPLQSQSFALWCQISRHSNSLPTFLKQKKKQSKTNDTPLFLRNHAQTKSTKNDIDFDFQDDFPSSSHNPSREEKDYDKDPEFADILGSCLDDPLKARSKMEERLRRKKNKILHAKTGSAKPMKVTFNKFDFSNSYIWFEFYNAPLENDVSLICDTFRSWHIVGRLGGCNSMNMQLSQSTFEKRPNYDAIQGANVTPATFYNIGDFEIQDNLARVWVDIGTTEPLLLDTLINALTQISSDYVGIKELVFGGSEFENWKENLTSEYAAAVDAGLTGDGQMQCVQSGVTWVLLGLAEKERKMAGAGVTLEELKKRLAEFAKERDWDQYHSPRNLLLAMLALELQELQLAHYLINRVFLYEKFRTFTAPSLGQDNSYSTQKTRMLIVFISMLFCISVLEVGEVGELSEIFQWKGEVPRGLPNWKDEEKEHLGEELSDVLLYLVRLSDICGVDLGKAAMRKLELNAIKYPIKPCEGSSEKHTQINAASHNNANGDGVAGSIYSDNSTSNSGV
ncbi:hypothetical protein D5086_026776 [Populus alba]|uniref:Uncharacterized protein n=1 Tax=Populus alba TaxID=43335 RepID=A0ACC4B4A7_POPAL